MRRIGPYISKLLRHDPENLTMNENGWVSVSELLTKVNITKSELDEIVNTNDKKRFSYNEDETYIRARQGHSVHVDVQLKDYQPKGVLYHGTSINAVESIRKTGINKGNRLHVHLSDNIKTAISVGRRKGEYYIFEVDAFRMQADNIKFFVSENGVYLTDFIDPKYLLN